MRRVTIINQTRPAKKALQVDYCDTFFSRLRGLMFRKRLGQYDGIIMIQPRANRMDAAIHMFFMNFDIAVVWADESLCVVDVKLARRWRPAYAPQKAAKYILEAHTDRMKDFSIGDQLVIKK